MSQENFASDNNTSSLFVEPVQPEENSTVHVQLPPGEKASQEVTLFDSLQKPDFESSTPEILVGKNFALPRIIPQVIPELGPACSHPDYSSGSFSRNTDQLLVATFPYTYSPREGVNQKFTRPGNKISLNIFEKLLEKEYLTTLTLFPSKYNLNFCIKSLKIPAPLRIHRNSGNFVIISRNSSCTPKAIEATAVSSFKITEDFSEILFRIRDAEKILSVRRTCLSARFRILGMDSFEHLRLEIIFDFENDCRHKPKVKLIYFDASFDSFESTVIAGLVGISSQLSRLAKVSLGKCAPSPSFLLCTVQSILNSTVRICLNSGKKFFQSLSSLSFFLEHLQVSLKRIFVLLSTLNRPSPRLNLCSVIKLSISLGNKITKLSADLRNLFSIFKSFRLKIFVSLLLSHCHPGGAIPQVDNSFPPLPFVNSFERNSKNKFSSFLSEQSNVYPFHPFELRQLGKNPTNQVYLASTEILWKNKLCSVIKLSKSIDNYLTASYADFQYLVSVFESSRLEKFVCTSLSHCHLGGVIPQSDSSSLVLPFGISLVGISQSKITSFSLGKSRVDFLHSFEVDQAGENSTDYKYLASRKVVFRKKKILSSFLKFEFYETCKSPCLQDNNNSPHPILEKLLFLFSWHSVVTLRYCLIDPVGCQPPRQYKRRRKKVKLSFAPLRYMRSQERISNNFYQFEISLDLSNLITKSPPPFVYRALHTGVYESISQAGGIVHKTHMRH